MGSVNETTRDEAAPAESVEVPALSEPTDVARLLLPVLLAARDGLSLMRLAEVMNCTQKQVLAGIAHLGELLAAFPLEVRQEGARVRVLTGPEVHPYLERLRGVRKQERLSPAALETLAVIAYRQPVIRAEIEAIRGVKAGPVLRTLLDHKLIVVVGRADVPGRPLQYGTGQHFLERFGLESLKDLPSIREFKGLG